MVTRSDTEKDPKEKKGPLFYFSPESPHSPGIPEHDVLTPPSNNLKKQAEIPDNSPVLPPLPPSSRRPWSHGPKEEKKEADETETTLDEALDLSENDVGLTGPPLPEDVEEKQPMVSQPATKPNPSSSPLDSLEASSSSDRNVSFRLPSPKQASAPRQLRKGYANNSNNANTRKNQRRNTSLIEAVVSTFRNSVFQFPDENDNKENTEHTPLMRNGAFQPTYKKSNSTDRSVSPQPLLDPKEFPDDETVDGNNQGYSNPKIERAWQKLREKVHSGDLLLRSSSRRSVSDWNFPQHDSDDPNHPGQSELERFAKRQEAQDTIRNSLELTMSQCVLIFLLFMGLSCAAFSYLFDHWSFVDAGYFAIVTCSTVGYGDLVPDSIGGRVFTCIYSLAGVSFLGIALGVLGNQIVESQEAAVEQTSTVAKKRLLSLFSSPTEEVQAQEHKTLLEEQEEEELFAEQLDEQEKVSPLWRLSFHFLVVMFLLGIFALSIVQDPGVDSNASGTGDLFDAFYFAIVTATTVGYGDYSPVTQQGRLTAIFFIPIAVGAMGHFLSSVAEVVMESRAESVRLQLASRELSAEDLEIMDADGDGTVTRAEFLEFMLVAMNKVDKEFIDELRDHFSRLDKDGTGILSKDDLIHQARQKLGRIQRKLELSAYKQKLLQQAAENRHRRRRSGRRWNNVVSDPLRRLRSTFFTARKMSLRRFASGLSDLDNDDDDCYGETSATLRSQRSSIDSDSLATLHEDEFV